MRLFSVLVLIVAFASCKQPEISVTVSDAFPKVQQQITVTVESNYSNAPRYIYWGNGASDYIGSDAKTVSFDYSYPTPGTYAIVAEMIDGNKTDQATATVTVSP